MANSQCSKCPELFRMEVDHHVHETTNENAFKCPFCIKTFHKKENQKKHIRTHTKEKTFICEICNRSYSRSDNLLRHIEVVHNKRNMKGHHKKYEEDQLAHMKMYSELMKIYSEILKTMSPMFESAEKENVTFDFKCLADSHELPTAVDVDSSLLLNYLDNITRYN